MIYPKVGSPLSCVIQEEPTLLSQYQWDFCKMLWRDRLSIIPHSECVTYQANKSLHVED